MATTTNYGWTTPDDTSLVKDGASAIRTLGSSVDTTVKNLNPETTLGDISYRSSTANTNTRLAIGTTGQVLTVSGGVPSWATPSSGSMTLLSTTTLSSTATTVSSIDQTYENLYVEVENVTWNTAVSRLQLELNSAGVNMVTQQVGNAVVNNVDSATLNVNNNNNDWSRTAGTNFVSFTIFNYAATNAYKAFALNAVYTNDGGAQQNSVGFLGGISSNSAITSITLKCGGNTITAGTMKIYGVK